METPVSRRGFLKTSALTAGAGITAPLWLPRLCSAAAPSTSISNVAPPHRLILDEVQYNPGEPLFPTSYADPKVVQQLGCNGKVYYMFDSPTLAVNWESVDPTVFPKDWCDLNAWVMAQWAHDPPASEESIFNRYVNEKLKLGAEDAKSFRQIALRSAQAVLRGHASTMSDISPWWTRDDGMVRPTLPEDPVKRKRVLDEKDQAVKLFEEICMRAGQVKFTDAKTADYAIVSTKYGRNLYRIVQAFFHLVAIGTAGEKKQLKIWLASYDQAWADYRLLPAESDQCATLYKEARALKSRGVGIDIAIADLRRAAAE